MMEDTPLEFKQEDLDPPKDPGPAVLGKTPLVGSVRRNKGLPVLRDEIKEEL